TGVTVTDTLPSGVNFLSASSSQGTCSQAGGSVTCNLGNLAIGASAQVNIAISPPVVGTLTTTASVSGNQTDLNPANNTAAVTTTITLSPPQVSINDVSVVEPRVTTTNAVFTLSLSRPSDKTVTVAYSTVPGTASEGPDYVGDYGLVIF